jgi:hypothetical protein
MKKLNPAKGWPLLQKFRDLNSLKAMALWETLGL